MEESNLPGIKAKVVCDRPNSNLEHWDGKLLHLINMNTNTANIIYTTLGGKIVNAGVKQLLLRGCFLKNTDSVYGMAIYTGHHTKIMMNAKHPPHKMSNVLKKMNELLYSVSIFYVFYVCFCVFFCY